MKKLFLLIGLIFCTPAMAGVQLTAENTAQELTAAIKAKKPVIIKFYAKWCAACKRMAPMFAKVEKKLKNNVLFYEVDVDSDSPLARAVYSVPTIAVFKDTEQPARLIIGAPATTEQLETAIMSVLNGE